jgi:hypothetical protein
MKRKVTLSIAIALSIALLALIKADSTVNAEPPQRFSFDTGVVTLGPNQILRVTVAAGDLNGDGIHVRFRRTRYIEQDNIYRIESQTTSAPLTLASNEAAVLDASDLAVWRAGVLTDSKDARVTVQIIDSATGQVNSVLTALLLP